MTSKNSPSSSDSKDNKQKPVTKVQAQVQAFSGPIPPPEVLFNYEKIEPGFANRIICMAEAQSQHRRELETIKLRAEVELAHRPFDETKLGQIFAFIICIVMIIAAAIIAIFGHPIVGGVVGLSPLVAIVYIFIKGRATEPKIASQDMTN